MVEAAVSDDKFEQGLEFYRRFFFSSCPQQRSEASQGIDAVLIRERGQDAELGIDIMHRSGNVGIADLTYREISMIFAYLDSETVLAIYNSTKDIKSFKKVLGEEKCKSAGLLILKNAHIYFMLLVRFVSFQGTLESCLPTYLRIPLYRAVAQNLSGFEQKLAAKSEEEFKRELLSDPAFI